MMIFMFIPGKFGILPPISDKELWEKVTCLIIGDSLLSNVIKRKMGPKFEVRNIPGCVINDFFYHVTPLLLKKTIFSYNNGLMMLLQKNLLKYLMS